MRALLLAALIALPATAQPLRQIVVPADAAVVVPPRGLPTADAFPPVVPAGVYSQDETVVLGGSPMGLGAVGIALLPLAAAAALGAGLAGGGGAGGAPASTR